MYITNLNKKNIMENNKDNNKEYLQKNPNYVEQNNLFSENYENKDGDIENLNDPKEFSLMIRLGFIRKVYGILSMQLLITSILVTSTFNESMRQFYLNKIAIFFICVVVAFILGIILICFKNIARKVPTNYILLSIWTFCESYMVAVCAATYDPTTVFIAAALTTAVTLSITLYACTTKTDFTFCGGMLFAGSCLMFVMGLFMLFFGISSKAFPMMNIFYCGCGVLLYSVYLIYDTQLTMGKFGSEYSIDDYVLAAMMIYIDIIQIFLYILRMLGNRER